MKIQEKVGVCYSCGKEINCLDGFLNGVVQEDGTLLCFDCNDDSDGNKQK